MESFFTPKFYWEFLYFPDNNYKGRSFSEFYKKFMTFPKNQQLVHNLLTNQAFSSNIIKIQRKIIKYCN